jgi:hypothetical protein
MANDNKQYYNTAPPESSLDLNMRVIDPAWKNIKTDMQNVKVEDLSEFFLRVKNAEGKDVIYVDINYLLSQLDFITRDVRLSNYDDKDLEIVRWYLAFAGEMASANMPRAFNFCIQKCAVYSETSQGRKGFLRKIINTFYSEQKQTISDGSRKGFFTGKNKGE